MISKQTIDKIFSTIRVEEIIGEYVQLKRAGSNLKGLSPFRDEKTASFVVSPSKQIWKDFSTGKGGSAISFLMEIEGFTYPEALRHAAKKYGIEIEEDLKEYSEEEKQAQTDKDLLFKIHEVANDFFQEQLWNHEEGKMIGLSYFKERELKDDIIKKFHLGYSPEQKNAFTQFATEKGYDKNILEKSGLSIYPENAPQGLDRFRERVIFPIHGFSGRVLGFGARILKNNVKTAKYLNSPETEIYHKSNVLYGLFQSKQAISKHNLCLLVEGYMDVVSLHQSGIEHVVASSGTALTVEQIKLIKRLTENVTILFDGDTAGIKASFRSIDMLLSEGMNIRVLLFPDGDDPDSFARKHPRDYVEEFIQKQAHDFIDFKAEILLKEADNDPIKKADAIRDIIKSIAFVKNPLKQEIYIKEVSDKFGLSQQNLFNEIHIQQQGPTFTKPKATQEAPVKMEVVREQTLQDSPLLLLENVLIDHMLKFGERVLNRQDHEGKSYEITVLEEIVAHFLEDDYEMQSDKNGIILNEIIVGLENNELRTQDYFLKFQNVEVANKIADTVEQHNLQNWESRNIYPPNLGDRLHQQVEDDILIHKSLYIEKIISRLKGELNVLRETDDQNYFETIKKIQTLEQLKRNINTKINRILTNSHIYFKE